jgi:hypothetical protein
MRPRLAASSSKVARSSGAMTALAERKKYDSRNANDQTPKMAQGAS